MTDDKMIRGIMDAMNTDLARAARYLKVARTNVDRAKFGLAAGYVELWERVAFVESEIALILGKIEEEQGND